MLNSTVQIRPRTAELFGKPGGSGLVFLPLVQDQSHGQGPARGTERDEGANHVAHALNGLRSLKLYENRPG